MSLHSSHTEKNNDIRLRVMVVDDTKLFRLVMVKALHSIQGVEVVATAQHGLEALEKLSNAGLAVDVVFLDVEMPELNGLETLKKLSHLPNPPIAIMVSGHNKSNMAVTIEALNAGAYDFIPKPTGASAAESEASLKQHMLKLLKAINFERSQVRLKQRQKETGRLNSHASQGKPAIYKVHLDQSTNSVAKMLLEEQHSMGQPAKAQQMVKQGSHFKAKRIDHPLHVHMPVSEATALEVPPKVQHKPQRASVGERPPVRDTAKRLAIDAVLIAVSTGGPAALTKVIPQLNSTLRVPVFIVQHMPEGFTASLAETLNKLTHLHVSEAQHNEIAKPAHIYIAPGGKHMELIRDGEHLKIILTEEAPVNACRPSADVLFSSAARVFKKGALALVMTGIGRDGANGVEALRKSTSTYCITQQADTCTVYGMPKAVDDRQLADEQCPLLNLATRINELTR